jgi:hypothetical protein
MAKPSLGMDIGWMGDTAQWMLVKAVDPGGLAGAAGLQSGDVILEIGGLPPVDFVRAQDLAPGAVRILLERSGVRVVRYLEIVEAPPPAASVDPFNGMFDKHSQRSQGGVETELVDIGSGYSGGVLPDKRPADRETIDRLKAEWDARGEIPLASPWQTPPPPFQPGSETELVDSAETRLQRFQDPGRRRIRHF